MTELSRREVEKRAKEVERGRIEWRRWNITSGWGGDGWIKVGAARCEKCGLEKLRMSRRLVEGNDRD